MSKLYTTAIAIAAKLSPTFRTVTKNAGAVLEKLDEQAKALGGAKAAAAAYRTLGIATGEASKRVQAASLELARLESAVRRPGAPTAELNIKIAAQAKIAKAADAALVKLRASTAKAGDAALKLGIDTAKLGAEEARLAVQLGATERAAKSLEAAGKARIALFGEPKKAIPAFEALGASATRLRGALSSVVTDVLKLGALGLGAGAGLFHIAQTTAAAGLEVEHASKRLGIGVEALQELRLAGKKAGVETETLDAAMGKLSINLGKVLSARKKGGGGFTGQVGELDFTSLARGKGGGGANDPFKRLGINAKAFALLKPEDQVGAVADGLGKLHTHAEKAAATVQLLGKGSLSMLPFLERGSKGIAEMREQARATGKILSEKSVADSLAFTAGMKKITGSLEAVKLTLGTALLPVFTRVFTEIGTWVDANREKIKAWALKIADWTENKAIPAIKAFVVEIRATATRVLELVGGTDGLESKVKLLVAAYIAYRALGVATAFYDTGKAALSAASGVVSLVKSLVEATAAKKALAAAGGDVSVGAPGAAGGGGTGLVGGIAKIAGIAAVGASLLEAAQNAVDKGVAGHTRGELGDVHKQNVAQGKDDRDPLARLLGDTFKIGAFKRELGAPPAPSPSSRLGKGEFGPEEAPRAPPVTVNGGIHITVPAGTTAEQAKSINDQVLDALRKIAADGARASYA